MAMTLKERHESATKKVEEVSLMQEISTAQFAQYLEAYAEYLRTGLSMYRGDFHETKPLHECIQETGVT